MAGPLIGLFEVGIIMAKIFRKREEAAEEKEVGEVKPTA
jgi:Sec-independent protein secretion pathway component TatC